MKYNPFFIVVTLLFILLGIWFSLIELLGQTDWLARAGAVIVILGIYSAIIAFSEKRYSNQLFDFAAFVNQLSFRVKSVENNNLEQVQEQVEEEIKKIKTELNYELENAWRRQEVILLILGTLLWGFGDLFF